MFKKENRYSFRQGVPSNYFSNKFFSLRYAKNEAGLKVAVVVSKKIDGKAVVRHTIKRRFMHAAREIFHEKQAPYSLVFFVRRPSKEVNFQVVKSELSHVLHSCGIIV